MNYELWRKQITGWLRGEEVEELEAACGAILLVRERSASLLVVRGAQRY